VAADCTDNGWVGLHLCTDVSAADWLVSQQQPWHRLAARGPLGYPMYARARFIPDPSFEGQREIDVHVADGALTGFEQLGIVLEILARYTATPEDCYFCLWDGWSAPRFGDHLPKVAIPNRAYWLFRGTITDFGDWGAAGDKRLPYGQAPDPAFVWPADRAWCVARDVDPHFATVGATAGAIAHLVADSRIDVVADDPGREPPYYC
jgi:hypothetical protein